MRSEVRVLSEQSREYVFELESQPPMDNAEARAWLDAQYQQLGCEPLRPTGKLLLADKVIVVARAAGDELLGDKAWGAAFGRAVSGVLGKPVVRLDLNAATVSY